MLLPLVLPARAVRCRLAVGLLLLGVLPVLTPLQAQAQPPAGLDPQSHAGSGEIALVTLLLSHWTEGRTDFNYWSFLSPKYLKKMKVDFATMTVASFQPKEFTVIGFDAETQVVSAEMVDDKGRHGIYFQVVPYKKYWVIVPSDVDYDKNEVYPWYNLVMNIMD